VVDLAAAAPLQHAEDALGAINLLMAVTALALALWRPGSTGVDAGHRPTVLAR
jgi:hypothetical protein